MDFASSVWNKLWVFKENSIWSSCFSKFIQFICSLKFSVSELKGLCGLFQSKWVNTQEYRANLRVDLVSEKGNLLLIAR